MPALFLSALSLREYFLSLRECWAEIYLFFGPACKTRNYWQINVLFYWKSVPARLASVLLIECRLDNLRWIPAANVVWDKGAQPIKKENNEK